MDRRRKYGIAAATVLFGAAALELGMIAAGYAWTRFSWRHGHVMGAVLATFFVASGVTILLRNRSERWMRAAFLLGVASALALFTHSLVGLGVVYLPVAFVQVFLLRGAFRGEIRGPRGPSRTMEEPEPGEYVGRQAFVGPRTPLRWN
jgi:hypothetical protein